jgi:hypothetical protein
MTSLSVLPFVLVAEQIGYTPAAAYVARSRGIFPVRVRQIGGKLVCFESDFREYLCTGESQAFLSVPPLKKKVEVKKGRPTKRESLEAARRGLSVKELRIQEGANHE